MIERQPEVTAADRSEIVNPERVGEQEWRAVFSQQLGRLAGQLAVGDPDSGDGFRHDLTPRG